MKDIKVLMAGQSITRTKPATRIKTRDQIEQERQAKAAEKAPGGGLLGGPLPEPGGA
jgi:hypothetical protein